ncbi:hypothetical protein [Cupriavidus neocaledonicus]|nr:hypothetical protein [Cupriavidus neocaledonicus]
MYAEQVALREIAVETGVCRREIFRQLNRFTAPKPTGGFYGLLALVPRQRIRAYQRRKPMRSLPGSAFGYAGAMGALLERYPAARDFLYEKLLGIGAPRNEIVELAPTFRNLHSGWKVALRKLGLTDSDWPFVTGDEGYTSLVRYCNLLIRLHPARAVRRRYGKAAADRMAMVGKGIPRLIQPLRPGTFAILDFSQIDTASCFTFETPEGKELEQVLPRWHLALLVDEMTSATWSAFSTLEIEPSSDSVLEALDRAVRPQAYTYGRPQANGVPLPVHIHELLPSFGFSGVSVLKLDNARCNRALEVVDNIVFTLGCAVNFGPVHTWPRRDVVERVFGQLSAAGPKRLSSSYGSGPTDVRRRDAAAEAMRLRLKYLEVEQLLLHCSRAHNRSPTERLHYSSPLEYFSRALSQVDSGVFPNPLPLPTLQDSGLLDHLEQCIVRGNPKNGVRPYIRLMRGRYTSPLLASSWQLLGKTLQVRIKRYDARLVTASRADTGEVIGPLFPERSWVQHAVSWRMRQLINRAGLRVAARDREDPLEAWKAERTASLLTARTKAKRKKGSKDALSLARQARSGEQHDGGAGAWPAAPLQSPDASVPPDIAPDSSADPFGLQAIPGHSRDRGGKP